MSPIAILIPIVAFWLAALLWFAISPVIGQLRGRCNKPPEPTKLVTYYVTVAEHNNDGLHVHHWSSPTPPTRESIILYLMSETSFEFEENFCIDDIASEVPVIEFKPTHHDLSYTQYRLSPNRTMTIMQVTTTSIVA